MSSHNTLRVAHHVAVGAVTALSLAAVCAQAGDTAAAFEPKQTVIRYSDLDLSKDADVLELYSRLQRASDRVCGRYDNDLRNLRMKSLYEACYQDTLARAVGSVGHAAVTAVHAADERIRLAGRSVKSVKDST